MNTFKKTGGFTLVELIIVIAILAILSSVAVAGYSSYITKANDSAAETFLNDLKTHIALANAKGGAVTEITVSADGKTVTAVVESYASDFETNFCEAYKIDEDKVSNDGTTITITLDEASNTWANSNYGKNKGAKWENNSWTVVK